MQKLLSKISNLGWYGGELKVNIGINRSFEGYWGRATEDWETQFTFDSNEVKNSSGTVIFPELHMKSNRNEYLFEKFIQRVEEQL